MKLGSRLTSEIEIVLLRSVKTLQNPILSIQCRIFTESDLAQRHHALFRRVSQSILLMDYGARHTIAKMIRESCMRIVNFHDGFLGASLPLRANTEQEDKRPACSEAFTTKVRNL